MFFLVISQLVIAYYILHRYKRPVVSIAVDAGDLISRELEDLKGAVCLC
jgi:hypothetical protein